jgi:tetratricopeptide (TPR) repeat protein
VKVSMAEFCTPLKKEDPHAHALCEKLATRGETLQSLDRGVTRLDYPRNSKPRRVLEGKGDGKVSGPEVYRKWLDRVESEEDRRAREYYQDLTKPPGERTYCTNFSKPSPFHSKDLQFLKDKGNTEVPFIFDDLDPKTHHDEELFCKSLAKVKEIKEDLKTKGLKEKSPEYNKALAVALFDFVRTPKDKGGLGIQFLQKAKGPGRNLGQIYAEGSATCLEFVELYYALGRIAGLSIVPIEVFRNAEGKIVEHIRIGVYLEFSNPKKILFLDIAIANGKITEKDYKEDVWGETSLLGLLSYHYNSLAIAAYNKREAGPLYRQALRYSPLEYMILNSYAWWLMQSNGKQARVKAASAVLHKALRINPHYPFIFLNLSEVYKAQGQIEKADYAVKKANALFQPHKFSRRTDQ